MHDDADHHRMPLRSGDLLFYGLWTLVLILALILQAFPFLLIVTMVALAFGFPFNAALTVIPIGFIAIFFVSCMVASKYTRRPVAQLDMSRAGHIDRTRPRRDVPPKAMSPSDYYRIMKRLG